MSRVWIYFFKSLAWPVGVATYIFAVVAGAHYANDRITGAGLFVIGIFIGLPILTYLIRDMWLDAKQKVERENYEFFKKMRGD